MARHLVIKARTRSKILCRCILLRYRPTSHNIRKAPLHSSYSNGPPPTGQSGYRILFFIHHLPRQSRASSQPTVIRCITSLLARKRITAAESCRTMFPMAHILPGPPCHSRISTTKTLGRTSIITFAHTEYPGRLSVDIVHFRV